MKERQLAVRRGRCYRGPRRRPRTVPRLTGKRAVTPALALRVAGIAMDELLAEQWLSARVCPHCGHPSDDFVDEETGVTASRVTKCRHAQRLRGNSRARPRDVNDCFLISCAHLSSILVCFIVRPRRVLPCSARRMNKSPGGSPDTHRS